MSQAERAGALGLLRLRNGKRPATARLKPEPIARIPVEAIEHRASLGKGRHAYVPMVPVNSPR